MMNNFNEIPAVSKGTEDSRQNESQKDLAKREHLTQGQTREKKSNNQPKGDEPSIPDIMQGKPFQGHGSLHGHNFQTKILCLYSCLIHTFKNFKIATEVGAAGKFDDLVLSYEDKDGVLKYTFLQAKQSLQTKNLLICPSHLETSSNFELTKYFQSYIDIQKQFENLKPDSLIEYLILYTNSDFDHKLFKRVDESSAYVPSSNDPTYTIKKLKNTSSPLIPGNSYQFVHIPKKAWKLEGYEDYYEGFQEKLIFAVKQADYNKINGVIENALSKTFNLAESQSLCNEMVGEIWNAFAQKTGRVMSDEIVQFFSNKREVLNSQFQHNVIFEKQNNVVNYENHFKDIKELKSFLGLEWKSKVFCVVSSNTTTLTSIKVAQALHCLYQDESYPEHYFCNVDVNHLMKQDNKDKIFHTLKNKKRFTLVLRWTDNSVLEDCLEDLIAIAKICKKDQNKKTIFICKLGFDYEKLNRIKKAFQRYEDDCKFRDLSDVIKMKLMSTTVSLQDKEVNLSDLIDETYLEQMPSSIFLVNEIYDCTRFNIGSKVDDFYDMHQNYIKRNFIRDFKYCKNIIENIPYSDVLVFSDMELQELEKHLSGKRVLTFNLSKVNKIMDFLVFLIKDNIDEEDCFEMICKYFTTKNIYWLIKNGNSFVLKKSVQNYYLTEDEIICIRGKLKVIPGVPGIGKSIVLTSILQKVQAKYKSWVIRINLASYVNAFAELRDDHLLKLDSVLNFICDVEKLSKDYEKELLQYTILKTDHCHLFFDGFDEICPDYEKVVIQLLQLLQTTKANIWITTRPHYQAKLGSELSCLCFSLIPFSGDDQKSFLESYWCHSIGKAANEKLVESFALDLIKKFTNSHIQLASQLIGIPLQTKMIADIYKKPCQEFCQRPEEMHNFIMPHNVLELYDEFTKFKYDVYFSVKVGLTLNNPNCTSIVNMVSGKLTQQHIDVAVILILKQELQAIVNSKAIDEDDEFHMLNVGLVIKKGEKYSFVHRTFAEYYIAKKLAEVIISKKLKKAIPTAEYQLVMAFLKEHYFDESNKMIRIFFDHILADSPILKATLEDKLTEMEAIIKKDITIINQCDCLGRTAWHLTAAYSNSQGPVVLWKYLKSFQIKQLDSLDCNVLSYAIRGINKNLNPIMGIPELLKGKTCNAFVEIILHIFNKTNLTKNELQNVKKFINSLFNYKEVDFWNKRCVKTFLINNMENFKKVTTLLETASPDMPFDQYPMEFFNYALTTDGYFNDLLLNNAIDMSSLSEMRKFTESEPFLNWFSKCVDSIDFTCLKRIEDIFGFKAMRKLTQVKKDDCRKMVKQAAESMHHECVCKFICTYKFSWIDINYVEYLEKMFVSRHFTQFDEIFQSALSDEMRANVLGAIKYVDVFKAAIMHDDYENVDKLLEYFGSETQIKEMKANVSSCHVINCFKTHIKKHKELKLAPFLKYITVEKCDYVLFKLLHTRRRRYQKIVHYIKDIQNKTSEITISDFHLPIIIQWLESYSDAMMEEYNWSIWEHLYSIFVSLLLGWPVPPDIKSVFGDGYLNIIIENKASFGRVAYIFHLVLDKEKCEICRYYDYEFLRYALCHYFHEIIDAKCNNGQYLKSMKEELLDLEEFNICFSKAVTNCDFAILLKLLSIIDDDNMLSMYKLVGYQFIFQSAFEQLEINFLVKLLKVFKCLPDDLNETQLFKPLLSTKYLDKLDTLLKYMTFKQVVNILSPIGCVQDFENAIKTRDFEKLMQIYDKYKDYDIMIDVMKKNVNDQDCIDYFKQFLTSGNASALHSLFQFISWKERAIHPPFLKYFVNLHGQIELVALSKKHLQNPSIYLDDYPSTCKLGSLNIWQHVYFLFGCLMEWLVYH